MFRALLVATLAAGLVTGAAGCGDDDGAADTAGAAAPAAVAATVTDTTYEVPARITGGVVAMRFRNEGTVIHEFALGRVGGGHTAAEAVAALTGADGGPPAYLRDIAGPGILTPGAEITITRTLAPGEYVMFDAVPDRTGAPGSARGLVAGFTVAGDTGAAPPAVDAVVTAGPDGFDVPPIAPGTRTIELRNAAGADRGFMLASLAAGMTEADVGRWGGQIESTGRLPAEPFPGILLGAIQSIPDGTSVYLTADLEAGRSYHLSDDGSGDAADFTPR